MKLFLQWAKFIFFKKGAFTMFKNHWLWYKQNTEQKLCIAKLHGKTLDAVARTVKQRHEHCNHRKGGQIAPSGSIGPGDGYLFSVIKHTYHWGDTWVRCVRCGKTWKPGSEGYKEALNFVTDNTSSSSTQWSGHGKDENGRTFIDIARENTRNT